jgi:FkbM family methyltransferase
MDFDSGLWGRARTQWMLGDWDSLASLELSHLEQAPHRAELAALSGCAQLQKGDKQNARKSLAAASRWNCSPAFMVRVLVAGSEASMARYHEICGRDDKCLQFLASSAGALGGDGRLAATARKALAAPPSQSQYDASTPRAGPPPPSDTDAEPPALTLNEAIAIAADEPCPFQNGITSYAQNFEDVMLWRALGHIDHGFYIDIGAYDPVIDSVSKAFYENGWRGIHVEASPLHAEMLRKDRPDDLVIQAAVTNHHGKVLFHEVPECGGISSAHPSVAGLHRRKGFVVKVTEAPAITLPDIIAAAGNRVIHWLKIDVEGMETHVLEEICLVSNKPWVVIVESTAPNSRISTHSEWEQYLVDAGYAFSYFDALNRFYLHNESGLSKDVFQVPYNFFDGYRCPPPRT